MTDAETDRTSSPGGSDAATSTPTAGPAAATPAAPSREAELERRVRRWRITSGVLAVVALLLGVIVAGQSTGQTGGPAAAPPASAPPASDAPVAPESAPVIPDLSHRIDGDPMAVGAVDAPVVVIEWFDYRCPFCATHANRTVPALTGEYVDEGLVRIEYRDVVLFGDDSFAAAVAGRAAAEQGRFSEYLAALFAAAPESGHPDMPREKLVGFAEQAGVPDIARFTADLDSPELQQAVVASTNEARQLGISSVPFFVVGDTAIAGAQPIEVFRELIDEQLAAARG